MHNKEYNEESGEMGMGGGWMGCMGPMHHMPKKMKKEFMLAMLRKKEKMLEAKLAFIQEMKNMAENMEESEEGK